MNPLFPPLGQRPVPYSEGPSPSGGGAPTPPNSHGAHLPTPMASLRDPGDALSAPAGEAPELPPPPLPGGFDAYDVREQEAPLAPELGIRTAAALARETEAMLEDAQRLLTRLSHGRKRPLSDAEHEVCSRLVWFGQRAELFARAHPDADVRALAGGDVRRLRDAELSIRGALGLLPSIYVRAKWDELRGTERALERQFEKAAEATFLLGPELVAALPSWIVEPYRVAEGAEIPNDLQVLGGMRALAQSTEAGAHFAKAIVNRGLGNADVLPKLLEVRHRIAREEGYPSAAHAYLRGSLLSSGFEAADATRDPVQRLDRALARIQEATAPGARAELDHLRREKRRIRPDEPELHDGDVPWLIHNTALHRLDYDALARYLSLDRYVSNLVETSTRLLGVGAERKDLRTWHDRDVATYLVSDHTGEGLLHLDVRHRAGKHDRGFSILIETAMPQVAACLNLPVEEIHGQSDVVHPRHVGSIAHEVGHDFWSLLCPGDPRERDVAEIPSLFFELWAGKPAVLPSLCRSETGAPLPARLAKGMAAAADTGRALFFHHRAARARLFLAAHAADPKTLDLEALTHEHLSGVVGAETPAVDIDIFTCPEIRLGAGMGGYLIGAAMAVQLLEPFERHGMTDAATGKRFFDEVLGSERPVRERIELFTGKPPSLEPLLEWLAKPQE